jgi:hypothetical protein
MGISEIICAVIGFGAGFGVRFVIDRRSTDRSSSIVNQSGSIVGKSQVGRDYKSEKDPR